MLLDGLIELLQNDTGVSGLVAARVYKSELPRGYVLPAIAAHRYGGSQDYDSAGPINTSEDQVQLDIYAPNADVCGQVAAAVKARLNSYTGTLSDGTVVKACYLERDMDLPFLPNADQRGIANRSVLGYRIVT